MNVEMDHYEQLLQLSRLNLRYQPSHMKQKKNYFAIVLDEYGGMTGIVTITDILESIVGDFDEDTITQQEKEPDIVKIDDATWKISGTADKPGRRQSFPGFVSGIGISRDTQLLCKSGLRHSREE